MIVGISVENAHGTHVTFEIFKINNKTRPTLVKEVTSTVSSILA